MVEITKHKKMIGIVLTMVLLSVGLFTMKASAVNTPSGTDITFCVSSDEGRLSLKWTPKNVDGYELNLAQNKEFTKNPQILTYDGLSRKASLTGLPSVTYYVRVRTFIKNGGEKLYSDWSSVSTINIHKHDYTGSIKYHTCTETETYYYKCTCGRYFKMLINQFGHNFERKWRNTGNVTDMSKMFDSYSSINTSARIDNVGFVISSVCGDIIFNLKNTQ